MFGFFDMRLIFDTFSGLLSWNTIETECDLKEIENAITNKDKTRRDDSPEILLQHSTEKLAVEVLLSPSVSTLKQCVKNMFLSPTAHKHLIHGGYSFTGTGSWMLDDGLFSFDDFVETLEDNSIRNFLESYSDSMFTFHIHCSPVGQWVTNDLKAQSFSKYILIELNPNDSPSGVQGAATLLDFLDESLKHLNLDSKMSSTEFIGNIRFNRPTLYVFPSGQGDCCLFGVSGFTMLIDGGFTPVPSFWNFIRHLERLDAIMVTRLSEDNLWGVSSLFKKKILKPIYPQIGYIFCNIAEGIPDSDKKPNDSNELLVSVIGVGQEFLGNVKQIGLNPLQCLREPLDSIEPMTLYHKVGLGTLQMFILSPPRDNKILKEFLNHWSSGKESFSLVRTGSASHKRSDVAIPLSNLMSICCLLVWKPSDPNEEITRMLFPGSAPQSRIFEGLNKIQKLDIFCQQKCTQSSIKTNFQTKDVKSSKPNRFRSVSPISRIKPFNVRQHSTETEKNKTVEEKEDINYISNNYKQKSIKQIPPLNKSEKKEPPKESAKKIVSNTKTDKSSKTEVLPEKLSVTQSPKKVTKSKKLSQTKPISKKGETQKKLNLNLNGIENQKQINESIVKAVNQKRESLERENEIQNKLLHSEYLKDDIEPDSLESVVTDGKISKDSLEVSEDEISSEKFFIQTDIIEEEELKSSMTTISPEMNVSVIESKIEENSPLIYENEDKKDVFESTVETMDTNLENKSEILDIQLEKHDIMESNIDSVPEIIDSKQFEAEDASGDQKQFEDSVKMSEKRSSVSGKTDRHQSICDDSICLDNKSLEKGSDEIEIQKENFKDSDQLSIEDPINKLEFKDVSKDLVLSDEYDSNDLEIKPISGQKLMESTEVKDLGKESLNESQKLIDEMLSTDSPSKENEIIKNKKHTDIDLTEKDVNKNESIDLIVKSEEMKKSDKPINFQVSTDDLNKIKDEKVADDENVNYDLNEPEVVYSNEESKYTKVNENIIGLNDDKIDVKIEDKKENVETLKMETKDLTEDKSQLESKVVFNKSNTDDTKDLTKEPEIKSTEHLKEIEIKDKDLEVLEIENKEKDLIISEVRVDENQPKYGDLLKGYVEDETKEVSEHTNDMKIIEEQTFPNQMKVLKSEKTTKDGDFSETKKESVKQDLTDHTIEPKIESFENKNQKVPEESKIEISIEYYKKLEIKDSVKDNDNQQNQQKSIKSETEKIVTEMYPLLEDTVLKDSPKDKNKTQFEDSTKETKDSVEFEFKGDLKKSEIKETDKQRVNDTEKGSEKSEESIDNKILFVDSSKNEINLEETHINTFGNMTKLEKDETSTVFKAENQSKDLLKKSEEIECSVKQTNELEMKSYTVSDINVTDIYSKESHPIVQSIEPKEQVSKQVQLSIGEEKSETEFKNLDKDSDFKQHLTEPETKELSKEHQLITSSTNLEIDSKSAETIDNSHKIKKFDGVFSDLSQSRDSDQSFRSLEEKPICGVDDSKADKYLYSESSIIDIKSDDDFGKLISTNVVAESNLFMEEMKNPIEFSKFIPSNNNSKSEILKISSSGDQISQTFNTGIQIEGNSNKLLNESKNTNQTNKGVVNINENLGETEPIIKSKTEEKTLSISSTNGSKQSNEESIVKEFKDNKTNDKQINAGNESKTVHSLPSTHVRRTSHVVEQPLYEDSDEEDNRSKQMTEQIIISNTLSADYPELISLSGGTTPSQSAPQSPHDSKSLSRSESLKSREKITIIDTILEDKDNEKQYQNSGINVTQIEMKSEKSKTTPKSSDEKSMEPLKETKSDKSLIESTSQQKEVKSSQMPIELKDNKSSDDLKTKTTLKESFETEVVIIEATESGDNKFNSDQWGRPLSLPTPPDTNESKVLNKTNVIKSNPMNAQKFSKPGKKLNGNESSGNAIYVELAYIPHHADQHYCNADYFKRVRAKYYVFSGINPHREVFEALIEGKKVWDKQFITTVIPTHESESLGFWINNNRNLLEEYMIAVAPAADRCTVNLQDYQTKCSAYRVEF